MLTRKPYVDPGIKVYQGVKLIPVSCPKHKFLEAIVHTFKGVFAARKLKGDILHVHAVGPALCVPVARLLGMKVVFTHHGPDYARKKWNVLAKMILKHGEWRGCKFAHEVICISKAIADDIRQRFKREVEVIPNGVAVPSHEVTQSQGHTTLKEYNLESGKYVLTVGRFVPEKGFEDLIDAFNAVSNEPWAEGYKLVIVGDADHEDEYSQSLKLKAQSAERVVLTGRLTGAPLAELYSHAGLFVLPSYYEGLPIVLLEAMGYGLSCAVSDIPANREVGLDPARYFKPGDVDGLAAKIREFSVRPLSVEEKERQMAMIREKYDWGRIAERTMSVYRKVIES